MRPTEEIAIVRAWMEPQLKEGVECPCCYKMCRIYGRKLNTGMAYLMVRVYQESPNDWVRISRLAHINSPELGIVNGDFTYLPHWGLLEPKPRDGGKSSGLWGLTYLGRKFGEGFRTVPHRIFLLNNKCVGMSEEQTDIQSALGDEFDYDELMREIGVC